MSGRIDPLLVELLVCPQDKQPLWYVEDEELLYNPRLRLGYRIDKGIPVLLVDEARRVDDAEHERLAGLSGTPRLVETGSPPSPV